jgi:V8-like Glu-specific endopeptidase
MNKSKNRSKEIYDLQKQNRVPKRPTNFNTPAECIKWIKKSVYLIARGRVLDSKHPEQISWVTIGTGCVVAPNRMLTSAHVINDPKVSSNELNQHKSGDIYYLVKHDDEDIWHTTLLKLDIDRDLFLYPKIDLAIIYLEESFYQISEKIFCLKDDYIRVDNNFKVIGTEIAVLGYPISQLTFQDSDITKPHIGNILLRVDTGVINSRYRISNDVSLYEFTVAFNPGNSGGPIFDYRTGKLISIVRGYKQTPITMKEHLLSDVERQIAGIKKYQQDSFIDITYATYSMGYTTPSFLDVLKTHNTVDSRQSRFYSTASCQSN